MSKIEITPDHLKLAKRMYIGWNDCEYGAPEVDCKRPYGNSDVEGDIAEILGWKVDPDEGLTDKQSEKAQSLHLEMQPLLQYLVQNADKLIKAPKVVEIKNF